MKDGFILRTSPLIASVFPAIYLVFFISNWLCKRRGKGVKSLSKGERVKEFMKKTIRGFKEFFFNLLVFDALIVGLREWIGVRLANWRSYGMVEMISLTCSAIVLVLLLLELKWRYGYIRVIQVVGKKEEVKENDKEKKIDNKQNKKKEPGDELRESTI